MITKNKYSDKDALLILGGPSIMEYLSDLGSMDPEKLVIFCESKALTPLIIKNNVKIDYLISPFADKCRDNSIQNFILRSYMADFNIKKVLKEDFHTLVDEIEEKFEEFYEIGRPHKSLHKKYRFKENKFHKDSPYDLLKENPEINVITSKIESKDNWDRPFIDKLFSNNMHYFKFQNTFNPDDKKSFSLDKYFNPSLIDDNLVLEYAPFTNSVASAIFAILNFLGFRKVYVAGMDMNMFGSCEYSAPYTFKSIPHFMYFLSQTKKAFGPHFKLNFPLWYLRPKSEFNDLKKLNTYNQFSIIRLNSNSKYSSSLEYLKNKNYEDFLRKFKK